MGPVAPARPEPDLLPVSALLPEPAVCLDPLPSAGAWVVAGPHAVEVHAEPVRDPARARLHDVACGVAVLAVRLELRRRGAAPVVRLLPRPAGTRGADARRTGAPATLLATLRIAGPVVHRQPEDRFGAPGARATSPPAFPALLRGLREEVALEGAALELRSPTGQLPLLVAVTTVTDTRADRMRAGMALYRLALASAEAGVRVTPLHRLHLPGSGARRDPGPPAPELLVHLRRSGAG